MGRRYVFTGGGTGGHVMPNLAVIREIQESEPDAVILYIGSSRGAEATLITDAQIPFRGIPAKAFASPRRPRAFIPFLFALTIGFLKSLWHIARFKPDVLVATGGYVSVAPVLAAAFLKRPVVLHEQNVEPGKANRLLSRFATAVGVSFEETRASFPNDKAVVTGYPLRKRIRLADAGAARKRLSIPDDHRVCFVVGGSMGSRSINRAVVEGLKQLLAHEKIVVIHSTGLFATAQYNAFEDTRQRLTSVELDSDQQSRYIVRRFFDNIEDAYAASDLVVARAGAGTLMELAAMKKPSLLIPKGDAGDAHQLANAMSQRRRGSSDVILEEIYEEDGKRVARVHGDLLAKKIRDLLLDDDRLDEMARAGEGIVLANASGRILELVRKTADGKKTAAPGKTRYLRGFLASVDGGDREELLFTHNSIAYGSTADIRLPSRGRGDRAIVRRWGKTADDTEFIVFPRDGSIKVNDVVVTRQTPLASGDILAVGDHRFVFSTVAEDLELPAKEGGVAGKVLVTGLGTLFSRIIGFVREAVLAMSFGAGRIMDVFTVSLTAANLLRRIFAENAADAAFLPTFLLLYRSGKKEAAVRLFRTAMTVVVLMTTAVTVVGIFTAPYWLPYFVYGFGKKGMTADTVMLTRIMMPYLVLIAVSSVLAAALKAFNRFGLASWASVMFSLGLILGAGLYPVFGIAGLGIGVLAGGLGQVLVQLPPFFSKKFRDGYGMSLKPLLAVREPGMRKVRATAPKIVADVSISKSETIVNTALASLLPIGSNAVLYFAMLLQQLPFALISLSINGVLLKEFSERQAVRDTEATKRLVTSGINWNVFLLMPTAAMMFVLAEPLVRMLYQYRNFNAGNAHLVAVALQCYAIGLVGWGVQGLMDRIYAARMEVGQAIAINAGAMALNIGLSALFVAMGMGPAGIALGTSVAFIANAGFRVWHVRRNMLKDGSAYEFSAILPSLKRTSLATLAAAVVAYFVFQTVDGFDGFGRLFSRIFVFGLPAMSGFAAFCAAAQLLRSQEMDEITARLRRFRPTPTGHAGKPIEVNLHALEPERLLKVVEKNPEIARNANLTRRIEECLRSPRWQIRNIGVKLIGRLGVQTKRYDLKDILEDRRPAPLLHRCLGGDFMSPGFMRRNAVDALIALDYVDESIEHGLITGLTDPYFEVRSAAARATAHFASRLTAEARRIVVARLMTMLREANFEVLTAVVHALQATAFDDSVLAPLETLHYHVNWQIRHAVVNAYVDLYKRGVVEDRALLVRRLEDILVTCDSFRPTFDLKESLRLALGTVRAARPEARPAAERVREESA